MILEPIVSVGQAAAFIQQMPSKILATAEELHIEPVTRINGVNHYSETDLQAISEFLQKQQCGQSSSCPNFLGMMR